MATVTPPETLLTAEEFATRPDPGAPEELVRGRIVPMPPPGFRHGKVCLKIGRLLGNFAEAHDLGHVLGNDSRVDTQRGPDTVRGPDISFYSFARVPRDAVIEGYPDVPPDLVVEVLSPEDRWPRVLAKVVEYLDAGVTAVVLVDPERRNVHLHEGDRPVRVLAEADDLAFPAVLGDFRVRVGDFLP